MDPESAAFTPRDDLWRFQSEMLRVQQGQVLLADRVSRLEQRQEEDNKLKNVWGTSSPFPSGMTGTSHQVSLQASSSDHFSNFDDQPNSLIGNLHLDADDEPRRIGATSRANSVRFDETANQGHWAHASRSSLDLIPRTGSGLGGHFMSERSYSHKSDGRQSSAGHSVHSVASGRANSLTSCGAMTPSEVPGLAPGLLILGSSPAIIRCWLNTDFKNDTLLYAAVCSGSYASYLDSRLIDRLGFQSQISISDDGSRKIKLPFYLPEAIPLTPSSRSSSPTPQVPLLHVDFTVTEPRAGEDESKAIQIFIGSDTLRAHNADILFSSNQLTLYDDQGKLQVPLVRPEDEQTFKSLLVTSRSPHASTLTPSSDQTKPAPAKAVSTAADRQQEKSGDGGRDTGSSDDGTSLVRRSLLQTPLPEPSTGAVGGKKEATGPRSVSSSIPSSWKTSWRNYGSSSPASELGNAVKSSTTPASQKPARVVLSTTRSKTRASSAGSSTPSPVLAKQSKFFSGGKERGGSEAEPGPFRPPTSVPPVNKGIGQGESSKGSAEEQAKIRGNPSGGATAFNWIKSDSRLK